MRFAITASLLTLVISSTMAQLPTGLVSGLSTQCIGGLSGLITNTDLNTCLSLTTALTTFSGATGSNSLVPGLQTYLSNNICPTACSASTLTSANQTIVSSCQAELTNGTTIVTPLVYLFTHYDTIRSAACLKDGNNLCIAETLNTVQTSTMMNITLAYLLAFNTSSLGGLVQSLAMNKTALCTDCNKALFTTLAPLVPSNETTLETSFTQQCGANSLGTIPTDITQSANGNSTNAATSSSSTTPASTGTSAAPSSSSGSSSGGASSSTTDGAVQSVTISVAAIALSVLSLAAFALVL